MSQVIKIAHLYPREMNIYGDMGNIITLVKRLEWRGYKAEVLPVESPVVVQGAVEGANSDPVATMIEMLAILRSYQANQSAISTQDASLGQLIRWASS